MCKTAGSQRGGLSTKGNSSSHGRPSLYVVRQERKNRYGEDGNVLSISINRSLQLRKIKTKGKVSSVRWPRQKTRLFLGLV